MTLVKLMHSSSPDAVGVSLNAISFRVLLRVLRTLPGVRITSASQHLNDEAFAAFDYKGWAFEIHTPLSDYWIDRPAACPPEVFHEIVQHLENFSVRWWHRIL